MFSKLIYEYFKLNTLNTYKKCEYSAKKIISNDLLLSDTLSSLTFKNDWYNKLSKKLKHNHFKFSIKSVESFSNLYRIHVTRNRIFSFSSSSKKFHKSNNENFIFIISKENNKYKIQTVTYKEENPLLYEKLLNNNLESDFYFRNLNEFIWSKNLNDINILYRDYVNITTQKPSLKLDIQNCSKLINCSDLIKYARKYALNYNSNYTNFNNSGGDCTNFVSQALNFAGLKQSSIWKPYTASWIMVVHLRDYLIKNSFATEYDHIPADPVGTIIQFFSPIKKRFSHTGIITDIMKDGELLYCCHDYDKLDFPLSETYPIFYQRIRNLKIK